MKITLCSSASFYKELFSIKAELEELGFKVLVPISAKEMQVTGNFDVRRIKTWHDNPSDFHKKTAYMEGHLKEIDNGDAILVVNLEKGKIAGYIGGNALLEMFYAWLKQKPIYILHPVSKVLPLYEEVMGMNPIFLNGDLSKITKAR